MAAKTAVRDRKLNLEKLRVRRGVSLDSITEATKIGRHFLEAIEQEEFEKLPGGVFNTSYLRQYAAAVGIEDTKLLEYYEACTRSTDDEAPAPKRPTWSRWLRAVTSIG